VLLKAENLNALWRRRWRRADAIENAAEAHHDRVSACWRSRSGAATACAGGGIASTTRSTECRNVSQVHDCSPAHAISVKLGSSAGRVASPRNRLARKELIRQLFIGAGKAVAHVQIATVSTAGHVMETAETTPLIDTSAGTIVDEIWGTIGRTAITATRKPSVGSPKAVTIEVDEPIGTDRGRTTIGTLWRTREPVGHLALTTCELPSTAAADPTNALQPERGVAIGGGAAGLPIAHGRQPADAVNALKIARAIDGSDGALLPRTHRRRHAAPARVADLAVTGAVALAAARLTIFVQKAGRAARALRGAATISADVEQRVALARGRVAAVAAIGIGLALDAAGAIALAEGPGAGTTLCAADRGSITDERLAVSASALGVGCIVGAGLTEPRPAVASRAIALSIAVALIVLLPLGHCDAGARACLAALAGSVACLLATDPIRAGEAGLALVARGTRLPRLA
jgi:hypothetical protein